MSKASNFVKALANLAKGTSEETLSEILSNATDSAETYENEDENTLFVFDDGSEAEYNPETKLAVETFAEVSEDESESEEVEDEE